LAIPVSSYGFHIHVPLLHSSLRDTVRQKFHRTFTSCKWNYLEKENL